MRAVAVLVLLLAAIVLLSFSADCAPQHVGKGARLGHLERDHRGTRRPSTPEPTAKKLPTHNVFRPPFFVRPTKPTNSPGTPVPTGKRATESAGKGFDYPKVHGVILLAKEKFANPLFVRPNHAGRPGRPFTQTPHSSESDDDSDEKEEEDRQTTTAPRTGVIPPRGRVLIQKPAYGRATAAPTASGHKNTDSKVDDSSDDTDSKEDSDDYKPTGSRPTPTQSRPTGSRPTPTQSRPTGSRPTPTQSRPTDGRPTGSRPTHSRPTHSRPTHARPTGSKPTDSKPRVSVNRLL